MQLEWFFRRRRPEPPLEHWLTTGTRRVRLCFARNRRARRYILRLLPDGSARVTIPRGGSLSEAKGFAERHAGWLERQLLRQAATPRRATEWFVGTEILFRGERVRLEVADAGDVRFGNETVSVPDMAGDLRPKIELHLRKLALRELTPLVFEFAAQHQLQVTRVTVRNQRSRWGSCSRRGRIFLNWRLVQAPIFVRDYIILHELAHLRQMNHSPRYWAEVERMCPGYEEAERWLKNHSALLGG